MKNFKDCYGILVLNQAKLIQSKEHSSEENPKTRKLFSFLKVLKKAFNLKNKNADDRMFGLKG